MAIEKNKILGAVLKLKTGYLKETKVNLQFSMMKHSEIILFFTCIFPYYVVHKITKEFCQNSHFENMTADFLLRCQKSLRQEISLICH